MQLDRPIRLGDRPQSKIIGPADQQAVETLYQPLGLHWQPSATGQLADGPTDPLLALPRRSCAYIGASRLRSIASANGVAQKVVALLRQLPNMGLILVQRQSQVMHDPPQCPQGFCGPARPAA